MPRLLKQLGVFTFVCFAWIFFRAASLSDAAVHAAEKTGAAPQQPVSGQQPGQRQPSVTIFDASVEEERRKRQMNQARDGFEPLTLGGSQQEQQQQPQLPPPAAARTPG